MCEEITAEGTWQKYGGMLIWLRYPCIICDLGDSLSKHASQNRV